MSEQAEEIRALVREKYGAIARKEGSCCGSSCGCESAAEGIDMIGDTYRSVEGYLGSVEIQDSQIGLAVIQAGDGKIRSDRRPMGKDGAALPGQT